MTVLDAFGGTASVAHALRCRGAAVTYNDYLLAPCQTALAVVANDDVLLSATEAKELFQPRAAFQYENVIASEYAGIFFLDEENAWLDVVAQNIGAIDDPIKRAIAFHCLIQAALAKRPYNLFHRANLSMRTTTVQRSFGNKTTWDTPFPDLFDRFRREVNSCVTATPGVPGRVLNGNAVKVPGEYDLVYADPPYVNGRGGAVDYRDHYGFLEGITDYSSWRARIDLRRKHRPVSGASSAWSRATTIHAAFGEAIERWAPVPRLVISYRSDGMPSLDELVRLLRHHGRSIRIERRPHKYVLSTNASSEELLLICD